MEVELTDAEARIALGALWAWRHHLGQTLTPDLLGDRPDLLARSMNLFGILDRVAAKLGGEPEAPFYGIPPPAWGPGLPPKPK